MAAPSTTQNLQPIGDSIPEGAAQYFSQALAGVQPKTGFIEAGKEPWKSIINAVCKIPLKDTGRRLKAFWEQIEQHGGDYKKISAQILKIDPSKPAPKERKIEWTCAELLQAEFPPIEWLIDGIVIEGGVMLFTAKPKVGKTWMAIQAAISVSSGAPMFGPGGRVVKKGRVIYYALEDNSRRLSSRLKAMHATGDLQIIFKQAITPLDKGGVEELRAVIEKEKPVLIVIDTFSPAHSKDVDENKSEDVQRILHPIRALADEFKVSFWINHHHKKGALGDPREDSRGSSAMTANVDVAAGIYKEQGARVLRMFGNDIEDMEFQIAFNDHVSYGWHIVGDVKDLVKNEAQREVLEKLEEMRAADVKALASAIGKNKKTIQKTLDRLLKQDKISRSSEPTGAGSYRYIYTLL